MSDSEKEKDSGDQEDAKIAEQNDVKIFVGNLPFTSNNDQIAKLFTTYGKVIGVNVREDRLTGKPKGFGFVTFEHEQQALAAIAGMHGVLYEGRPLTVKPAEKRGTKGKEEEAKPWITRPPPRKVEMSGECKICALKEDVCFSRWLGRDCALSGS